MPEKNNAASGAIALVLIGLLLGASGVMLLTQPDNRLLGLAIGLPGLVMMILGLRIAGRAGKRASAAVAVKGEPTRLPPLKEKGIVSQILESRASLAAAPDGAPAPEKPAAPVQMPATAGNAPAKTTTAAITLPKMPTTPEEAVDVLVAIYRAHPEGFSRDTSIPEVRRIREIGSLLNGQGGMDLMLRVHETFSSRCGVYGAARNLEIMWDRIGEWLG